MSLDKKKELRKEILRLRDALPLDVRREKNAQIASCVIGMKEFQDADIVMLYSAIRSEVETTAIVQEAQRQEKKIYYPKVLGDKMEFYLVDENTEMEISAYGICEPKPESTAVFGPNKQDKIFVLMPGVVFDESGNRIGYGGGYYDKYLHWLGGVVPTENIYKVAVAYECQLVELGRIESELHDVRPEFVITEESIVNIKLNKRYQ